MNEQTTRENDGGFPRLHNRPELSLDSVTCSPPFPLRLRPVWYGRDRQRLYWERGMRVPDEWLDSVVYLYPSHAMAMAGERIGGSGFIVGLPMPEVGGRTFFPWVVTNRHVVLEGSSVVRLNTHQGGFDTIELDEREWHYHPDGDDLAVCPLSLDQKLHKIEPILFDWFLTKDLFQRFHIAPGDPAFVVGRFAQHEGRTRNVPTVRFGQIAQIPVDKVRFAGGEQESFLVEIRSLGGYSGSPVLVWIEPEWWRDRVKRFGGMGAPEYGPWLLGVDYSMIPLWDPVCDREGKELPGGWQVPANSGIMGVIPAWRLQWLLTEYGPVVQKRHVGITAAGSRR